MESRGQNPVFPLPGRSPPDASVGRVLYLQSPLTQGPRLSLLTHSCPPPLQSGSPKAGHRARPWKPKHGRQQPRLCLPQNKRAVPLAPSRTGYLPPVLWVLGGGLSLVQPLWGCSTQSTAYALTRVHLRLMPRFLLATSKEVQALATVSLRVAFPREGLLWGLPVAW